MSLERHYETLGVRPDASAAEIKSAYRRLVLLHHPDKSPAPESARIFSQAGEAYEVLKDPERRKHYDVLVAREEQRRREAAARAASPGVRNPPHPSPRPAPDAPKASAPKPPPRPAVATVPQELTRLQLVFNRGQTAEAERLALALLDREARLALPNAILGDIARGRGRLDEALRRYAFAAQFDPAYQRWYEDLLNAASKRGLQSRGLRTEVKEDERLAALGIGGLLILIGSAYLAVTRETPLLPSIGPLSSLTVGLVVMAFLSGVVLGASLSMANVVDRFASLASNSLGRPTPMLALATVAIVNFWAAAGLYLGLSVAQRGFNVSTSRTLGAVAGVVLVLTVAAAFSPVLVPSQVFLWAGNLAYLGVVSGWTVADSLKR